MPSLSIVIPAYNEARRLRGTLSAIAGYLDRGRFAKHEIIVVDDGSSDETAEIAAGVAEVRSDVRVLRATENRGKGAALQRGVLASRSEYVLCTDADLSTPIEELDKLLPRIVRDGYDVAIGSRKIAGSDVSQPRYRKWIGDMGNVLIRAVLGLPYRDTQCGFKLYRRSAALKLFSNLRMPRFSFDFEVLLRAKKLGLRVAEVGVRWTHSPFTTVRTQDVLRSFFDVFRVRFGLDREFGSAMLSPELLKFMSVGVLNTAVDASVYVALTRIAGIYAAQPVTAKLFSFLAATLCSFMLNRSWTFKVTTALTSSEVARFYASSTLGLAVNVSAMYALVHLFGIYDLVALVLTTAATFAVNFTLAKLWVFRAERSPSLARQY